MPLLLQGPGGTHLHGRQDLAGDAPISRETREIMRAEIARGHRSPYRSASGASRKAVRGRISRTVAEKDEAEFRRAVVALGIMPGTPKFEDLLAAFHRSTTERRSARG